MAISLRRCGATSPALTPLSLLPYIVTPRATYYLKSERSVAERQRLIESAKIHGDLILTGTKMRGNEEMGV
jgi:hypothetical protein